MEQSRFPVAAFDEKIKSRILSWAAQFDSCFFLDNNGYEAYPHHQYELLVGADSLETLEIDKQNPFDQIDQFLENQTDFIFTCLAYDVKNYIERLESNLPNFTETPEVLMVKPRYVIYIKDGYLHVNRRTMEAMWILDQIKATQLPDELDSIPIPSLIPRLSKSEYLEKVEFIRSRIAAGDYYELNFCQEFYAEQALDPIMAFNYLNNHSKSPFSAFIRHKQHYVLCASPERFLQKNGNSLRSMPMKGTGPKGKTDKEDLVLRDLLRHDIKERAENVMIVDLVRNDLTKCCNPGSIDVDSLFEVYGFNQVNALVSEVSGQLRDGVSFTDIIKATFPMGSMTGAPKIAVMQQTEELESCRRGWYSGTIGYLEPNGNFDLNVVIRSLVYHATKPYLSLQLGGAITWDSIAEKEYAECMLKGRIFFGNA